ncbi:MAG: 2-oxoacid:acceptor oxidoreductase family protein [Chloroflexota bacterium]
MKEVRIHARGGQGALSFAEAVVIAATLEGKFASAFPITTSEKIRAPFTVFLRLDEHPIREKTQVYQPDCLVVMEATRARSVDLVQGIKRDSILLWNGQRLPGRLPSEIIRVGLIDATGIARELLGSPTGTPDLCGATLGAFAVTTGWVKLESVTQAIKQTYAPALAEKHSKAATLAYENTRVVSALNCIN